MDPGGAAAGSVLGHALNAERRAGSQCDVVFEVGGQPLPAHRLVVKATCPVFERMFAGEFFREKDGRVEIRDVTRAAFEKFLEFLYTEQVADWGGCEVDLLELSDRYLVAHLRAACELRLAHMTDAVALTVLRQAPAKPVIDATLRRSAARALVAGRAAVASVAGWAAFKSACPILADAVDVAQEEFRKGGPQASKLLEPRGGGVFAVSGVMSDCSALARGLNAAREAGRLCDVDLVVDGERLPAHRVVLTTCSPYFLRKYAVAASDDPAAPRQRLAETVDGVSKAVAEKFLEFVYTECVADWAGLEMELLELAQRYEVVRLVAQCERRLEAMDTFTALSVLRQAADKAFIGPQLRRLAARRAVRQPQLTSTPSWPEFEAACGVLADVLRVGSEEVHPAAAASPGQASSPASSPASPHVFRGSAHRIRFAKNTSRSNVF